jgi:hypothetical protein
LGQSLKWGLTSKLLPPGVSLAMARRRAFQKGQGMPFMPGPKLTQPRPPMRQKVSPVSKTPSPEEKKTEGGGTGGGSEVIGLAKDIGALQARITQLEKEIATLRK